MSDKAGVSVDCQIKTIFDKTLATDFKKLIIERFEKSITSSSVLELDDHPKNGFSLNATLELTRDDKSKPPQLKGTIAVAIVGPGITATTINLKPSSPSSADVGSNPKSTASQAKALV